MTEAPTFAKSGGPPDDWRRCRVFDADTGAEVRDVVEVDTQIGYLLKFERNEQGRLVLTPDRRAVRVIHLTGNFRIEMDKP